MTGTGKKGNTTKAATVEILQEHVADLFARSGEKTRLVLKYRHCDSKLSLRVTDDRKTAKYTTRRQAELGKIKRLVGLTITGKAGEEGLDGSAGAAGESPTRSRKGAKGKHKAKKG
jgi:signal recognition particle subunit SRP9